MNPTANPFVVNQLVPENRQGGGIYQLNDLSVSPTRFVDVNEEGLPVEETIMALAKSAKFVDRDGNICDVALRTGRVPSEDPEAVRYEQIVTFELIRAGQMPLASCPYTNAYRHIKGGPLMKPPAGEQDCGGKPDGCAHMLKEIERRRAVCRERHEKQQQQFRSMGEGDIKLMMEAFGKVFGDAVANAAASGRANLRGPGEQDPAPAAAAPVASSRKKEER